MEFRKLWRVCLLLSRGLECCLLSRSLLKDVRYVSKLSKSVTRAWLTQASHRHRRRVRVRVGVDVEALVASCRHT